MEFREVVRRRRMVRRYAERPVEPAVVDRMLAHATRAPSAGWTQGWSFLVLDAPADVAAFWAATSPDPAASNPWLDGMRTAPVVIVPLLDEAAYRERYADADKASARSRAAGAPWWWVDTAMAALLLLQTATDEGLGACLFGIPAARVEAFRHAFGVPEALQPLGAVTVGHRLPDDDGAPGSAARRARRPLEEVVRRGRWS